MTAMIRHRTAARYRGLPVTVFGIVGDQLLAVAAFGTPHELAIGTIAGGTTGGRRVYCVTGSSTWTVNIETAARTAAALREARDVSG